MAESRLRPVPKQRRTISPGPFGATAQPLATAEMYDTRMVEPNISRSTHGEFFPDASGLSSCVRLKNTVVIAEQKQRDSQLPRLLFDLDEACKRGASDVEKGRLAMAVLYAASSPVRKYRMLYFFELLENNKDAASIVKLPDAFIILEKYATNLLKNEKPQLWKVVKFNLSIIQNQVFPVKGAVHVLKQMGYTVVTENAFTFPDHVDQPDIQSVVVLAADLVIARVEVDALLNNRHPFLTFPRGIQNEISAGSEQSILAGGIDRGANSVQLSGDEKGGVCGVCSEHNLAKSCAECDMQFCKECDERWHTHVRRRSHFRINLLNPALKEKADKENSNRPRPVPVPRQRVKKPEPSDAKLLQGFTEAPSAKAPGTLTVKQGLGASTSGNVPLVISSTDLSYISPSHQEIKRPPSRSSSSLSPETSFPVSVSQSSIRYNPSPQGKFPFSAAETVLTNTQTNVRTPQGNQRNVNPLLAEANRQDNRVQRIIPAQPQTTAKETVSSCPNCFFLVLSSQLWCPSCKQLLGNFQNMEDTKVSPTGLVSPANYSSETGNPLRMSSDVDNLRNVSTNVTPQMKERSLQRRRLPDLPAGGRVGPYVPAGSPGNTVESLYEEVGPIKTKTTAARQSGNEWSCEHCTFLNPITTLICQTCFRTPSDLKNHPSNKEQSQQQSSSSVVNQAPPPKEEKLGIAVEPRVPVGIYGASSQDPPSDTLYMTPKDLPLEGGIYMAPKYAFDKAPSLPPKKLQTGGVPPPGGKVLNAQVYREQELSEKEKMKKLYEEKCQLFKSGHITEDEFYDNDLFQRRKISAVQARAPEEGPSHGINDPQLRQLIEAGVISQEDLYNNEVLPRANAIPKKPREPELVAKQDTGFSDEQLQQLINVGVFSQDNPLYDNVLHREVLLGKPSEPESRVSYEERVQLYKAGIIPLQDLGVPPPGNTPVYETPRVERPSHLTAAQADIQAMFDEFRMLDTTGALTAEEGLGNVPNYADVGFNKTVFRDAQNYHVTRDAPLTQSLYDKVSSKKAGVVAPRPQDSLANFLSSPNRLDNPAAQSFRTHTYMEDQGRMYIQWMKQAESHGFTPEELNLATNLSWQDPKERNPAEWLKDEWTSRVVEVIGKVTELTKNENDRIGNLSTEEAKQALLENDGSVQSACKFCIESRREKLAKMAEVAVYGRVDCLNALDNNNGDLDKAFVELEKKALEPIRKRVLGMVDALDGGVRNPGGADRETARAFDTVVTNKDVSSERRTRVIFAEKNMKSWGRAETTVKLIDMGFSVEDSIEAAEAYGDLERSIKYLQQECPICLDEKPMGQMITFLSCQDRICKDCVAEHLTVQIKERNIRNLVCPVCGLPDLSNDAEATEYFNNLDIMMRQIVDAEVHDLFQQKLRDRTLRKEPNFRWCAHCSYGFIYEQPDVNKMLCGNCRKYTCFSCKRQWEDQHEGISCEEFARWQEENNEEFQIAGLAGHLERHGIDCPECKFRYDLAKGGCMHFKCGQCSHEFCSGCYNPFKKGEKCNVSQTCARKGIHAHHPRDCLFYLRDWTPERLQQLLTNYNVDYNIRPAVLPLQDEDELGDEEVVAGAVGGAGAYCKVMEQKETPNGLQDAECGAHCEDGHDGLCKVHYTEYLVSLIKRNNIDPADVMEVDEMTTVLGRAEIQPPLREQGEDEDLYKERILNMLRERLPLALPAHPLEVYEEVEQELEHILV